MRSYEVARSLFSFLAFMAWSVVVVGVIVALIGAAGASQYGGSGAGLLATAPGIYIGITGLILVAFVEMGRATVDTAEYTQQMLSISRDQLEVSKQGLKLQSVVPQTFAAAAQKESAQEPRSSFADQTPAASPPEHEPEAINLEQPKMEKTTYRGKTITVEDGKFHIAKMSFTSLEKAQTYIDQLGVNEGVQLSGVTRNS